MVQEALPEAATTRERVRAAALELFGEKGYDGASMHEIAERVGIAKPSLYNYYRSKEELLLDLVDQGIAGWAEACMVPFTRPASFERQLAEHLRRVLDFARDRPHVVAVFHLASTHVQGALAERVTAIIETYERRFHADIVRRVEEAIAAGKLEPGSAEEVMAFLVVFFHGILFLQTNLVHQGAPTMESLPRVWRFLFRAISGREPRETLPA